MGLILIARTFTNPWYLVECVITFCLTFFIMNVMERVWGNTGYDYFWSNKSFFNFICESDDELEKELDDYLDKRELTIYDNLLFIVKKLEEEGYSDEDVKIGIVRAIEDMKKIVGKRS